jgi:hypothetical protein
MQPHCVIIMQVTSGTRRPACATHHVHGQALARIDSALHGLLRGTERRRERAIEGCCLSQRVIEERGAIDAPS